MTSLKKFLIKCWNKLTKKNKKKLLLSLAWLFLSIVIIPHLIYSVSYIIELSKKLREKGDFLSLPRKIKILEIVKFNNYKSFFDLNDSINKGFLIAILAIFIFILIDVVINLLSRKETYETAEEYASHGSSRWMPDNEIKDKFYKDKKGWFLGGLDKFDSYKIDMDGIYSPESKRLNMQTIVIGPPSSFKTSGFVLPNILNIVHQYLGQKDSPDFLITDPKSEIYYSLAEYLKKSNYEIYVLDFINLKYGDCINPIDYIEKDDGKALREICKDFITSMSETDNPSGDLMFWNNQEYQLLAALVGFVIQKKGKDSNYRATFENVVKILTSSYVTSKNNKKFFENNNITGTPVELWNNFTMFNDSEKTKSSILGGLAEKMNLFSIDGIKKITEKTTLRIEELGLIKDKPKAVFIFMPDGTNTFRPIINMIVSTIFNQLYKTAYKHNNRLEKPVYTILDEFCTIGRIPNINEKLGTFRSRKIYPMLIMQSLAQLKSLYSSSWESIISQCDTQVYLGINDDFTAKQCSGALGQTTIKSKSVSSDSSKGIFELDKKRDSEGYQGRALLLPDECRRLDNEQMIIIQRSLNPIKAYKVTYNYLEEDNRICDLSPINQLGELPSIPEQQPIDKLVNIKKVEKNKNQLKKNDKETNKQNIETKEATSKDLKSKFDGKER